MAASPSQCRLRRKWLALVVLTSAVSTAAPLARTLTLRQVNERNPNQGFAPVHLGERVVIQGVVNSRPYRFGNYELLALEDGSAGALLQVARDDTRLETLEPGDELRVTGVVSLQDGVGMIQPVLIEPLGRKPVPAPANVSARDLAGFSYLGRLVQTEGRITAAGDTAAGSYVKLDLPARLTIFLPRSAEYPPLITGFDVGSTVRVTGVGFQFCTSPPYDRYFQVLVNDPAAVRPGDRSWAVRPSVVGAAVCGILLAVLLLWQRERRANHQRERLRKSYQLGEEILSSSSIGMILGRLAESLPGILGISQVHLYLHNRAAKALDSVPREGETPVSLSFSAPPVGAKSGAVACFHYRTLIVIPDVSRSPFPLGDDRSSSAKSLLFVPMLAQGEVIGVLELDQNDRVRDFSADEQELAQHFGNQAGVTVRLLDQRSVQEQLFRTEKLAAVGRLISGVVNELQAPLASISDLAGRALDRARSSPAERDVLALASEARKASGMVARLVSFAAAEQAEARHVSINNLLHNLIEFREGDSKATGIRVRELTSSDSIQVLGSHGQLEQVFLNLLVHAEQALSEAAQKTITVRTSVMARRVLVEISFTAPPGWRKAEETAAVLGVTRSVIGGHGGEVRLIEKGDAEPRFEVELPVITRERTAGTSGAASTARLGSGRKWTALVIEPDEAAQRQMVTLLTARGCRVIPVDNADTGFEHSQRLRFDLAFCSVHAPGLNWVELSERMHSRVGAFVLLSDGYDSELAADFEGDRRFVLPKPVQEPDIDRILAAMEPVVPAVRHGAA
jgi:GAF domain-containing protein/CheY-like chemotaxis protein